MNWSPLSFADLIAIETRACVVIVVNSQSYDFVQEHAMEAT